MNINTNIHKNHLFKILSEIYKNPYLNASLGFKGGTAGMFFYNLPRLSVDLDFDLIQANLENPENSTKYKKILSEIESLLKKDYQIKDQSEKFNTLFWAVSYGAGTKQIKVEISTRKQPFDSYESKNLYGIGVNVSTLDNLIAHKLVALVNRKKIVNRDLFDTHYYLSKFPENINYQVITHIIQKDPLEYYDFLLQFLNNFDSAKLLDGIGELIDNKQKDWVKNSLLEETKGLIQKQIDFKIWETHSKQPKQ